MHFGINTIISKSFWTDGPLANSEDPDQTAPLEEQSDQGLQEHFDLGLHCLPFHLHMSRVMRKPTFCICENKGADQLLGNRKADQPLCFCYIESTITLLSKSETSTL